MGDNRNMFLAIGLSLAVIVLWQFFFIEPQLDAQRQVEQEQRILNQQTDAVDAASPNAAAPGSDIPSAPQVAGSDVPQAQTPGSAPVAAAAVAPRVTIETPSVDGSINLAGGRLDDLKLKDYHVTPDKSSDEVVLLAPAGTAEPYFVETGWVPASGQDIAVPTSATVWTLAAGEQLTPDTPVTLSWDNGAGVTFNRTISVDEHYMFTVEQTVQNNTGEPIALHPYSRVRREGQIETLGYFILHEGFIGVLGEEGLRPGELRQHRRRGHADAGPIRLRLARHNRQVLGDDRHPRPGHDLQPPLPVSHRQRRTGLSGGLSGGRGHHRARRGDRRHQPRLRRCKEDQGHPVL